MTAQVEETTKTENARIAELVEEIKQFCRENPELARERLTLEIEESSFAE